ncbi:MAG: HD domain-containing protein [Ilumatobacteraceae bacterium]
MTSAPEWVKGTELEAAFTLADEAHTGKTRKDKDEPYINHLINVAEMVRTYGGSIDQIRAAFLHDTIEDTDVTEERLSNEISPGVARIVVVCTDTEPGDVPPAGRDKLEWRERKARYHLRLADKAENDPALLVSLCDKIDNSEDSARDARALGPARFWEKFNAGGTCQYWNYTTLLGLYREKLTDPRAAQAVNRLARALDELFAGDIPQCTSTTHSHDGEKN